MQRNHSATRISQLVMFSLLGIAVLPTSGLAANDDQAEQEARRFENEARRQDAQARREIEERDRIQAAALRGQEEAIRRMEATQARMTADAEQRAQQAAEQSRLNNYPTYIYIAPTPPKVSDVPGAPEAQVTPVPSPAVTGNRLLRGDSVRQDDAVSGMSFAPLTERLKSYFGTQSGVLVVGAGAGAPFGLQDGDVIISIDGRVPADVDHVVRILRSYQHGEHVKLRVQRDRRVVDLDARAPD